MPNHNNTKWPDHHKAWRVLALVAGLSVALVIAGWEFIGLRMVDPDQPLPALESTLVPWGGLAGREAARYLETRWRLDPPAAEEALGKQLARYPLNPWRWLLLARIDWRNHADIARLRQRLTTAIAVQPNDQELRWQAANLAQSTGDRELVMAQLRQWLAGQPNETGRALFIARRWVSEPGDLLDQLVPAEDDFLTDAMRYARRSNDIALARATWQRLEQPRAVGDAALTNYIATALGSERRELAMQAWQQLDPDYTPGDIPLGSFSMPLEAMPAFGWDLSMSKGATLDRIELDGQDQPTAREDAQALRISFSGRENIHLSTPAVRFPVARPGSYKLSGWWRAENLTTRSLPYVQLYTESGEHPFSETVTVPDPDFEWQRFEIPFEVTEAGELFRFRLRRNRTDAFDRYIAGSIWLANLNVFPLNPET